MSYWRGRRMGYDRVPAAEQKRQQWVYRQIEACNDLASLNPETEYERHRQAYLETGSTIELDLMLKYVS